jgi:CheY-like chemotaxis protein
MNECEYSALVVDDEPAVRRLVAMALARQGFHCHLAADGQEAERQLEGARFDVVVTDLKMPRQNGHALAASLLQRAERPLVVVHTGVLEPALARDLIARGVDDIVFKPINLDVLACKVRRMVEQRAGKASHSVAAADSSPDAGRAGTSDVPQPSRPMVGAPDSYQRAQIARRVYGLATSNPESATSIANAIVADPDLAAQVLQLANDPRVVGGAAKITSLEEAVRRVGCGRIVALVKPPAIPPSVASSEVANSSPDSPEERPGQRDTSGPPSVARR